MSSTHHTTSHARRISSSEIRRYAKISNLVIRLRKERALMRQDFLNRLDAGATMDVSGQWILSVGGQNRINSAEWSWKMYATQLAIEIEGGDVQKGMARIVVAEATAPRKLVRVVVAKANAVFGELFKSGKLNDDGILANILRAFGGIGLNKREV